ncbi:MAG: histidine phosphatase family protein [Dehalococcoidales bacterium]
MSKLLLVRHGDTKLSSAERFWGQTDVELSVTGIRQAERLRDRLALQEIDVIYSSNLRRASATAQIIASNRQVDIIICAELREINFGELEGLTFKEVSQLYPEVAEAWSKWSPTLKYPSGESINELNNRVSKFLEKLKEHTPEETILIVAHSAPLRLLICHLTGIGVQHWRQIRLDLASLSILDTYPQGAILNLLNDVSHLR